MDRIIAIKEKVFRMKQNTLHKSVAIRAQQLMARKKKQLSVFTLLILDRIIARNNTDKIIAERFFGRSKLTLSIFLSAADTAKFLWKKRIDFPFLSFYTDNIIAQGNKGFMDEVGRKQAKSRNYRRHNSWNSRNNLGVHNQQNEIVFKEEILQNGGSVESVSRILVSLV